MEWASDLPWAALLAVLIAGPWGVVLIVALLRGYDVVVSLTRRQREDDAEG